MVISLLDGSFDRQSFDCGVSELNAFLQNHALQNQKKNIGKTRVGHSKGSVSIMGYYTIATASMDPSSLPLKFSKSIPKYPVPCVLLARLAADLRYRGTGVGSSLMKHAMARSYVISKHAGAFALIAHAKDENAADFYRRCGFASLPVNPLHLFIPMESIKKVLTA